MSYGDRDELIDRINETTGDLNEALGLIVDVMGWIEEDWFGQDLLEKSPVLLRMKEWLEARGGG